MVTFETSEYVSSAEEISSDELDTRVMKGEFSLWSIGYGGALNDKVPSLKWWWKAHWINTKGMGNYWELIILPGDERTSQLYGFALEQYARNKGLSPEYASVWASSKIQYKHDVLIELARILNDSKEILAYLDYPGYGPGAHRGEWIKKWNMESSLSAPRQEALAKLVQACIKRETPESVLKIQFQKKLNVSEIIS